MDEHLTVHGTVIKQVHNNSKEDWWLPLDRPCCYCCDKLAAPIPDPAPFTDVPDLAAFVLVLVLVLALFRGRRRSKRRQQHPATQQKY